MKDKEFDCVEMKHRAAEKIYEQIKDMTLEEELAFWQQETEKLTQYQRERQKKSRTFTIN